MCRLHVLIFANCICLAFWDQLHLVVGYHFYISVQFADKLLRIFASVFTRHVGLQSSCAVSAWFCCQDDAGLIELETSSSSVLCKMLCRIVVTS